MPWIAALRARRIRDVMQPSEARLEVLNYALIQNNDTITFPRYGASTPIVFDFYRTEGHVPIEGAIVVDVTADETNEQVRETLLDAVAPLIETPDVYEMHSTSTLTLRWWDCAGRIDRELASSRPTAIAITQQYRSRSDYPDFYIARLGAARRFQRLLYP
jgi:hypothetical protein